LIKLCIRKNLKTSPEEIKEAIRGQMTDHHRFMLSVIRKDIARIQLLIDEPDKRLTHNDTMVDFYWNNDI
jgi:hypothetical protein